MEVDMLRLAFSFGVIAFVSIVGHQRAWAVDTCEAVRQRIGAGPGQLINLKTESVIAQSSGTPLSKPSDLRLAYIVPNSQNPTGALIVKARHQLPKDANAKNSEGFPSGDLIRLRRPAYTSPCTNRSKGAYDTSVKLEHYVDQHYYGINYTSMDDFHADVGYRNRRVTVLSVQFDRRVCKNTYDPESRASFLYSGEPNPMIATDNETYVRRAAILAKQVGFISEAFADQAPRYKDKLHTSIVPYTRANRTSDNCVSFEIAVPDKAGKTDIEIIDADEGRSTWQISWGQN